MENAKMKKIEWDILVDFQTICAMLNRMSTNFHDFSAIF